MPALHLTIPRPCQQSWDAMTPTAAGHHCAACQKTVVDFTQMADAEILAHLARAGRGETCGRFRAGQLARPLRPLGLALAPRWRAWLAAAVAVWGLREVAGSGEARAQVHTEQRHAAEVPEQLRADRMPDYESGERAALVLRGVVLDEATREELPGATVLLKDTPLGTATQADGSFELVVPAGYAVGGRVIIQVKSLGYVSVQQGVSVSTGARLMLQTDTKGYVELRQPWPWYPQVLWLRARNGFIRLFR